jgi:hypothetical protein
MRLSIENEFVEINDGSRLPTIGNFKAQSTTLVQELDDSNQLVGVIYNGSSEPVGLNASGRIVSATAAQGANVAANSAPGGTPSNPVYAVAPTTSGAATASSSYSFGFTPPQGAGTYVVTLFADDANGNLVATAQVTINSSTGTDINVNAVPLTPVVGQSSSAPIATINVATGNAAAGIGEEQSFDVATSWSQLGPPTGPVGRPL